MRNLLPNRFQFAHDYCLYLHDNLVELIDYGEKHNLFNTQINFSNDKDISELESHENPDIFEWLEKNEEWAKLGEVLLKQVFPALLSDFCHFIYEALSCSRKAKLTVSCALLRKPLHENLLYLEWLLADPSDLLNTLYHKNSKELSIGHIGNPDNIKNIINKAVNRTLLSETFDHEYIYSTRFDKTSPYSLELLWNRALHLITTKTPIATEKQNFNFIFSGEEEHINQWAKLYGTLPYLLLYTTEICERLFTLINAEPLPDYKSNSFHKMIGFFLWITDLGQIYGDSNYNTPFLREFILDCPSCGYSMTPTKHIMSELYNYRNVTCESCNSRLSYEHFV